jgi:NADPH-dependent curcumin reductase CurA
VCELLVLRLRDQRGVRPIAIQMRHEGAVAGFATFPETLLKLFAGENFGKLVLQVADV